jgi:DNA-binding response OmpR family regulator
VGRKIIIVDAEPVVRTTVAAILETEGYEVMQAEDPLAVVEIIESDPPALIITNVSLPGISGHDAMRLYKRHSPDVPVLMISGLPDTVVIEQWRSEPGFAVFPKPFTASDLSAKVREMMTPARAPRSVTY